MKIGKYIIEIVPKDAHNFSLNLPINDVIWFKNNRPNWNDLHINNAIKCKHIKPNTGIRYSILGKYWIFLVIKQLN